jgi:excisionase family DNA binding protein
MYRDSSITGYYTTAQAADILGVSSHEITRLARAGRISAIKASGNAFFLDAIDVRLYESIHQGKGRPLTPSMAGAAFWILSGLEVPWLSYQQLRRLRIRLVSISVSDLLWLTRNRSTIRRCRVSESFTDKLKEELIPTGRSYAFNELSVIENGQILEGYTPFDFETLEKSYHLIDDVQGNLIIHMLHEQTQLINPTPIAVAAADLALSLDTREKQVGRQTLERLLDEYRQNRS